MEGGKVKAKNERNRKRKKLIGQVRKQSKESGRCGVVSELTVEPQWPDFSEQGQATIRRGAQQF